MTRSFADFGVPAYQTSSPSMDTGEMAIRLKNGMGSQHRTGRWLFATDFENGLAEVESVGATIATTGVYMGKQAAQVNTTAVINNGAYVQKYLFPMGGKVGLEVMVAHSGFPPPRSTYLSVILGTGTRQFLGQLRLQMTLPGTSSVQVLTNASTYVTVFDATKYVTDYAAYYMYLKIIVDLDKKIYDRFIFCDQVIKQGVEGLGMLDWAAGTLNTVTFRSSTVTETAAIAQSRMDNFIVTVDE